VTADEAKCRHWKSLAGQLQERVLHRFWIEEESFFAIALDRGPMDEVRQVATLCSNAGLLLESRLLDEADDCEKYIDGVIRRLWSDDFLTPVGIRCRALRHEGLINFADYHGSWAVWAKETFDIAKGLRRHGFFGLAEQLETRILNGIRLSGRTVEFWYVDGKGRVDYDPFAKQRFDGKRLRLIGTHYSEDTQAWTISAALASERNLAEGRQAIAIPAWKVALQQELLQSQPRVVLLQTEEQAAAAYPTSYAWALDQEEGRKRRRALVQQPFD
jgi:glycogen debranching enzyme